MMCCPLSTRQIHARKTLRLICIGAHPDDCEIKFGGTAAMLASAGHAVKFVSVTNGAAGHHEKFGPELVEIRRREADLAAQRLGIAEAAVLNMQDGELQADIETRVEIIRQIRNWRADVVLSHRACDYHPDHRYSSQLVQDAAYLVLVPSICSDSPPLKKNPLFLFLEDDFQLPIPFQPDIAVDIDNVWQSKILGMDAHVSQFYEWLPWIAGKSQEVPQDVEGRRRWLSETWSKPIRPLVREALKARYGAKAESIVHAEAFQVCEYGRQPSQTELDELFPR
jgi:LmbE family N-acetylglucosaminyl deacetylase